MGQVAALGPQLIASGAEQAAVDQKIDDAEQQAQAESAEFGRQIMFVTKKAGSAKSDRARQADKEMGAMIVALAEMGGSGQAGRFAREIGYNEGLDMARIDGNAEREKQALRSRQIASRNRALSVYRTGKLEKVQIAAQYKATAAEAAGDAAVTGAVACWVAREVYGPANMRWLLFRRWMLNEAPAWFRDLYLEHGAAVADWLRDKPRTKKVLRVLMDRAIA